MMNRRVLLLPLGLLLAGQTGCAARGAGREAGMMGAMVVGGLDLGGGRMHGMGAGGRETPEIERFQPARLLAAKVRLELTDAQVTRLEQVAADVAANRATRTAAALDAYQLLRPDQRAAVGPPPAAPGGHH